MIKKIVLGIVFLGLSAGLVYGAVNRTAARAESGQGRDSASTHGNNSRRLEEPLQSSASQTRNGQKGGQGNGGRGKNGNNGLSVSSNGTGFASVEETLSLSGVVAGVDENQMMVVDTQGTETVIENRAWWYALEAGFQANTGDEVQMTGFYEDGVFETITLENRTQGLVVQIRETTGRPLWAGGRG